MQRAWLVWAWPVVVAIIAVAASVVVANAQTSSKLNSVDRSLTLWDIQPGLGTIMMEYSTRFGNAWWAEQGGNWDMVEYQLDEMTEIQEVGEKTRPARADALKKFEDEYLKALIDAAAKKDKTAFEGAYDRTINGCNQCHGDQKNSAGKPFRYIKIVRPTSQAPFSNVQWSGQ